MQNSFVKPLLCLADIFSPVVLLPDRGRLTAGVEEGDPKFPGIRNYSGGMILQCHPMIKNGELSPAMVQTVYPYRKQTEYTFSIRLSNEKDPNDIRQNLIAVGAIVESIVAQEIKSRHLENYTQIWSADPSAENAEALHEKEVQEKMNRAIEKLSPQCREAFTFWLTLIKQKIIRHLLTT